MTHVPAMLLHRPTVTGAWQAMTVRGLFALTFGTVLLMGAIPSGMISLLFCLYAVIDGALLSAAAWRMRGTGVGSPLMLGGLAGMLVGLTLLARMDLSLIYGVAAWGLLTGVAQCSANVRLRRRIPGACEGLLGATGSVGITLGLLLFFFPMVGLSGLAALGGVHCVVVAGTLVLFGTCLRTCRARGR